MNKFKFISCVIGFSFISQVYAQEDIREEILSLLKNRPFDFNIIKSFKSEAEFQGQIFKVDLDTGRFYREIFPGERQVLRLEWDGSQGRISDHGTTLFDLAEDKLSPEQKIAFNGIALIQRHHGIYTIKAKNPLCYLAYADQRFDGDSAERIAALERSYDPRPLLFKSDEDWAEFKADMRNLFKEFKNPEAYIAMLGSSTTFFSVNPKKGKTSSLYEAAPECIEHAKDREKTQNIYTFDTPGFDKSDVDINILIPVLSELCEEAFKKNRKFKGGNDGTRVVYVENTVVADCLAQSDNPAVKAMLLGEAASGKKWPIPGKAFGDFFDKWTPRMDDREINFSIRIRPDHLRAPLKKEGAPANFEEDVKAERVVIPLGLE